MLVSVKAPSVRVRVCEGDRTVFVRTGWHACTCDMNKIGIDSLEGRRRIRDWFSAEEGGGEEDD